MYPGRTNIFNMTKVPFHLFSDANRKTVSQGTMRVSSVTDLFHPSIQASVFSGRMDLQGRFGRPLSYFTTRLEDF